MTGQYELIQRRGKCTRSLSVSQCYESCLTRTLWKHFFYIFLRNRKKIWLEIVSSGALNTDKCEHSKKTCDKISDSVATNSWKTGLYFQICLVVFIGLVPGVMKISLKSEIRRIGRRQKSRLTFGSSRNERIHFLKRPQSKFFARQDKNRLWVSFVRTPPPPFQLVGKK